MPEGMLLQCINGTVLMLPVLMLPTCTAAAQSGLHVKTPIYVIVCIAFDTILKYTSFQ